MTEYPEPRYKKLYTKHMQKKQLLEQKRKELEQEARKMHETVERMRGVQSNLHRSKSAKSLQDSFSSKKSGYAFERLHNSHKDILQRKEGIARKALHVIYWHNITFVL